MSLRKLINSSQKTFSFELYPPKTPEAAKLLYENLDRMKKLNPSFISVTMGAMGSNQGQTFEIVQQIEEKYKIHGVAHLTCVGATREKILNSIDRLRKLKIRNLLCLRGDPPQGATTYNPPPDGFRYANELVSFVREKTGDEFSLGVAGYPEGHIECPDKKLDLLHLKKKADAGAEYILTQLFFDNQDYFDFVDRAKKLGISIKIIPGIMPITNFHQLQKFTQMCGSKIPKKLQEDLENIKEDAEGVKNYGVEYATSQCKNLLKHGAPGIHFYTLNQAAAVEKIFKKVF